MTEYAGSEVDEFGMGSIDDGFGEDKFVTKSSRQPFEVDYKVFSPTDIEDSQARLINEVQDILGQPPESTAILLRHFHWNRERLLEAYMDNQEAVLEAAGLGDDGSSADRIRSVPGFVCDICCDEGPNMRTFALKCEHRFCVSCFKHYVTTKVKDEGEAARIKCPGEDCSRFVDSKSLETLLDDSLLPRCVMATSSFLRWSN